MAKKCSMVGLLAAGSMVVTGISASAQTEAPHPMAPTAFEGRMALVGCGEESTELVEGVTQRRALHCTVTMLEMSDPRLEGIVTLEANRDDRPGSFTLYVAALRIEGDEGAWQQVASPHFVDPGGRHTTTTGVFEGEGAYEGLMAVVELSNTSEGILDLSGFILEGEVPPIPDVTRDEGAG